MPGPYAQIGPRLIERGYAALPIMPNSKRPGSMRRGEWVGMNNWHAEYSTRLPSRFESQIWSQSGAGVGVLCGPGSHDLCGADIDTDRADIKAALLAVLPPTTVRKSGAKGETLFYRWPGVTVLPKPSSWNIDGERVFDLIGPGRQTVLPPTIHEKTGEPYRWTGPDALDDVDPSELPELPADIAERITAALIPFGYKAEQEFPALAGVPGDDGDSACRAINNAALANLEAWVPKLGLYRCQRTQQGYAAVATWRASNTGRPPEKRKLNLHMTPKGVTDFGDGPRGYTPINLVCAANSLGDDWPTAFKALADALGPGRGVTIALKAPSIVPDAEPPTEPANPDKDTDSVGARAMVVAALDGWATDPEPEPDNGPRDALDHLTRVPGVVGDLIDWMSSTARRPNRVLALGAALTIVGTLVGRRVATPTRSGTHLYVVTLAPTGAGKQHAINCMMRAMFAAGAQQHIGPSEFISMPAVINCLLSKPLSLCAQDEFGAFLKRINSRRASGFEASISKTLRQVWGSSFEAFVTPEWAGRPSSIIRSPAMSLYGLSTPSEFYESLSGSDLSNGFLNRFLVLSTSVRTDPVTPETETGVLPESLVGSLKNLFSWTGTALGISRLNDPDPGDIDPDKLEWTSLAVQDCYNDFERQIQRDMDRTPGLEHFVARTAEIAVKLATIRAIGRVGGRGASVDLKDMEWGRDVALACGRSLAAEAKIYMAENDRQSWSNRVLRIIQQRGTASARVIQQGIRGALRSQEVKDILASLVEAGSVDEVKEGDGLIKKISYRFVG